MRRRGGLLTRWELAVLVVLVLATAAWARPRIERATWRTRRAEAEHVLETLAEHAVEVHRRSGSWPDVPTFPRPVAALDRAWAPWAGLPEGFTPPIEAARCAYRVEGGAEVRLIATCDVDGDGVPSITTLVPGERAVRTTPEDVY